MAAGINSTLTPDLQPPSINDRLTRPDHTQPFPAESSSATTSKRSQMRTSASVECSTRPCAQCSHDAVLMLCAAVWTIRVLSHPEGWFGFPTPLHHSIDRKV